MSGTNLADLVPANLRSFNSEHAGASIQPILDMASHTGEVTKPDIGNDAQCDAWLTNLGEIQRLVLYIVKGSSLNSSHASVTSDHGPIACTAHDQYTGLAVD